MTHGSPYDEIDPMQRWSTAAAAITSGTLDPQGHVKFRIHDDDRLASAGSCFSMRLAQRLRQKTANYFVAEPAPSFLRAELHEEFGYAPFAARYGLVFTTEQLMQLFARAFGRFVPVEHAWVTGGGFVDPFRPRIAREPFASVHEVEADRRRHLAAVRMMFESIDVFVFTMGLSELWRDRRDGAVFPFCPGLSGGTFDPALYEFYNLTFADNYANLQRFIREVREVNPRIRIVLTVSPVPIGATMEAQHVVRATTYTKSVLRAVAEEVSRAHDFVDYFAAYEMVSQAFTGDDPFVQDRRHLKEEATDRVLDAFCAHYLDENRSGRPQRVGPDAFDELLPCGEDIFAR